MKHKMVLSTLHSPDFLKVLLSIVHLCPSRKIKGKGMCTSTYTNVYNTHTYLYICIDIHVCVSEMYMSILYS